MIQFSISFGGNEMGLLEWSASVIGSVAWPVSVVVVALIFRSQINKLLKRIKGAKYGDAEVEFSETLDKLEAAAEAIVPPDEPMPSEALPLNIEKPADEAEAQAVTEPNVLTDLELQRTAIEKQHFAVLANLSPSAAVLSAWQSLELTLEDMFIKSGLTRKPGKYHGYANALTLYKLGVIDKSTMDIINDLKNLRNAAAHTDDVSFSDALRFDALSRVVKERLAEFSKHRSPPA